MKSAITERKVNIAVDSRRVFIGAHRTHMALRRRRSTFHVCVLGTLVSLQKWMNRSRCHFEGRLMWAQKTMYQVGGVHVSAT